MDETGEIADAITACVVETMNTSTEEIVESTPFYVSGIENILVVSLIVSALFIIFRLGLLFVNYIKTGRTGDFENDSFVYNLINGNREDILPALVFGTFPASILMDILGFAVISSIIGLVWGLLAIFLPIIGVAYLIRRPIARKQEFIERLNGTHNEDTYDEDGGS